MSLEPEADGELGVVPRDGGLEEHVERLDVSLVDLGRLVGLADLDARLDAEARE